MTGRTRASAAAPAVARKPPEQSKKGIGKWCAVMARGPILGED
jgi:hypothetical protein